jgi:site-specific recombinase XerD
MLEKLLNIPGSFPGEPYHEFIRQFSLMMYQDGNSVLTIKSYGWHLNHFSIWLIEQGVSHPSHITPPILLEWGGHLRSIYSPQTQKLCIVAIKSFYRFLVKLRACTQSIFEDVKNFLGSPKVIILPQRTFTAYEIASLVLACEGVAPTDVRARTLIMLLLDTGLRAAELCGITQKDVDMNSRKISILGKGGQKELVFFGFECQTILQEWLDVRGSLSKENDYFFVSLGGITPGDKITPRGLRIILKRLGEKAGIANVHPHAFRRSFATLRIKDGQSTRGVQLLGRWKNLSIFERYTQALMSDDDFARDEAAHFSPLKDIRPYQS